MADQANKFIGLSEVAAMAGVSKQAVVNWRARYTNFPRPLVELQNGPIWNEDAIVSWLKQRKEMSMSETNDARQAIEPITPINDDVRDAIDLLAEIVGEAIDAIDSDINLATQRKDYVGVSELAEKAKQVQGFRLKVKELEPIWERLRSGRMARTLTVLHQKRALPGRAPRGRRTPEEHYIIPVLESIVALGGRGKVSMILEKVGKKLQGLLNEYDLAPVPSNPEEVRWKNAVKWCRNSMVNQGLLSDESQHGIWEITDMGRKYLESSKKV